MREIEVDGKMILEQICLVFTALDSIRLVQRRMVGRLVKDELETICKKAVFA